MKDLIDSVEENVKSLEKKTLYRKGPISKANWKITKLRKAHESGQEYTNHKGKLTAAKTIKVKKDCMNSCKFQYDLTPRIYALHKITIALKFKSYINQK